MKSIIRLKDVEFSYPNGQKALKGINLEIFEGEKIALVGSNGAGKSTLLLMLNGMLKPDAGTVFFKGEPVSYNRSELRDLRKKVGFVFQNPDHQIIAPTVFQDVAFGPVNLDYTEDEINRSVSEALMYVDLSGFERRPPHQLSGGEKKKVAIAGVLAMEPEVLVFDEPTSALDPASSEGIMELLEELNHEGKTTIISTHDVELAYPWADRIILMNDGMILTCSSPADAFSDGKMLRDAKLSRPVLLELYSSLFEMGMLPEAEKPPRSVLDFVHLVERGNGSISKGKSESCGSIYLVDADRLGDKSLKDCLESIPVDFVGAMGSYAKKKAESDGIDLNFTYGVIDKCLLKAISGQNSMIITTGGMIKRVIDRVNEFCEESGKQVDVVSIDEFSE
ncbi:cobalt ABC transporter, ATPase subunit [Methanolacinia petrolearia DSM 11571]|uniref:ABC transporter ATP-binding protein n=1 Tax=Methanolacinia petrolearia (strain DSM 11571 / OCM 486 / SEBR 4847) TaxID=679926 RepID=E1RHX7_METP4|nr:ATP-binding cassette domain-containing protein [Methanolacinia petrolearia]ADN36515.1 cobalt ABC transporter, ATPase subunit [Methanolacinia petrolearia DSM 11571]